MPKPETREVVSFRLDSALLRRLDEAGWESGFSRPEAFRVAVLAWCESVEEKARLRRGGA